MTKINYRLVVLSIIMIMFFLGVRNPKIFGSVTFTPVLYLLFLATIIFSVLDIINNKKMSKKQVYVLVLIFSILPSVLSSNFADIALLKLFIYSFGMMSITWLCLSLDNYNSYQAIKFYMNLQIVFRIFVILCFLLFLFAGQYAYPRNKTGLGGLLSHPQMLGIVVSVIAFFELYGFMFIKRNFSAFVYLVLVIFLIYHTESRTAFLAFLLGGIFLIIKYFFANKNYLKKKIIRNYFMLLLILLVTMPFSINIFNTMISKHGRSEVNVASSLSESRLYLALASFENFKEHPYVGIGFQVSNGENGTKPMKVRRMSTLNIPIEARIEKGVFLTALLEETGLIGFSGFFLFLLLLLKSGGWSNLGVGTTVVVLLISFGESILFSMGGAGLFCWTSIIMANTLGKKIDNAIIVPYR